MKKVTVVNNVNGIQFSATMQDPTAWIAEQVAINSWGLPEAWTLEVIEGAETKVELDEFGVEQTYYKKPCEYTIEIKELDADPEYLLEQAIKKSSQNIEFGKYILSIVGAMVQIKNLDCAGVASLNATFSAISMLLQTGSIETAKNAIAAIEPTEVVTAGDITYIVGIMNNYLGV
jgi:hypothetical protein